MVSRFADRSVRTTDISSSQMVSMQVVSENRLMFTDMSTVDGDGWIRTARSELLFWVSGAIQTGLHRPSTVWVRGVDEVRLDPSRFAHGSEWAKCFA